ncbi:hypothetical protein SISNIDRAFT_485298 [Sistotremastrum niveocremeum HHB9708]|uniref:Uncharacterized protein n=1 Tax=Sistotremastrum niveocremeum HHB9708 TaxID=1314777 RepID=A0A164UZV7_9AGAM|nr:hypothetical protein SISNIDRAFT_485298 [Sistotremastrum niveocremeum HHB9708]
MSLVNRGIIANPLTSAPLNRGRAATIAACISTFFENTFLHPPHSIVVLRDHCTLFTLPTFVLDGVQPSSEFTFHLYAHHTSAFRLRVLLESEGDGWVRCTHDGVDPTQIRGWVSGNIIASLALRRQTLGGQTALLIILGVDHADIRQPLYQFVSCRCGADHAGLLMRLHGDPDDNTVPEALCQSGSVSASMRVLLRCCAGGVSWSSIAHNPVLTEM